MDIIKPFIERDDPQVYFSAFADKQDYLLLLILPHQMPLGLHTLHLLIFQEPSICLSRSYIYDSIPDRFDFLRLSGELQ